MQVYIKTYEKMSDYHYKEINDIQNYIQWLFYHKSNDLNKNVIIIATDNDTKDVVGFIGGDTYYYDKELGDYAICVHEISIIPEYQGLKIGYSLINEFLDFSKKYNKQKNLKAKYSVLYVGEKNNKAINFYQKLGYTYFSKHGKWLKMIMHLE
ncbi:MAG: GNAT family N-acetyltransferase [bacterium]